MLRVTAIGNLGGDATVNNVSGEDVVNFNVAVTKRWKNKDGDKKEKTTWISCSYWGKANLAPFLLKGSKILVEGEPSVRIYKNREGEQVPQQDITVTNIVLLDRKPTEDNGSGSTAQQQSQVAQPAAVPGEKPEDDLPF